MKRRVPENETSDSHQRRLRARAREMQEQVGLDDDQARMVARAEDEFFADLDELGVGADDVGPLDEVEAAAISQVLQDVLDEVQEGGDGLQKVRTLARQLEARARRAGKRPQRQPRRVVTGPAPRRRTR